MSGSWLRATGLAMLLVGLAALTWHGAGKAAEDKPGTETLPADLARVPAKSLAMFSVRIADVWASGLAKGIRDKMGKDATSMVEEIEKKTGLKPENIERATLVIKDMENASPMVFFATSKAFDRAKVFSLAVPGGREEKYSGETIFANDVEAIFVLGEKAFVVGAKGDIQSLIDAGKDKPTGGLAPALALAAKKHSAVVAVNPAVLAPVEDMLPAEAEPFKPLFKASSATLTIDFGKNTIYNLRVAFAGADEAARGVKAVEAGRKLVLVFLDQGMKEMKKDESVKSVVGLLELARKSLESATIKRDDSAVAGRLELIIDQATVGANVAEAVKKVREAADRMQSGNNLKQIGLAMHNYHDRTGAFPAQAVYDKDGKALLSWRVTILPYLDKNDLYKQFKLDEAWDGPNNKKLLAKMPDVYKVPAGKAKHPHGAFYQGFFGKGAFFEGKTGIGIRDITDGTSNTLMIVEAGTDVPWTKPEDLPFDPDKPLPKLGSHYGSGVVQALFCDGAVRSFSRAVKEATLKAVITRNGGEVLGPDF